MNESDETTVPYKMARKTCHHDERPCTKCIRAVESRLADAEPATPASSRIMSTIPGFLLD